MSTAIDILSYAKTHNISLIAENGQLKINAPKVALTDEFLESAKAHKTEIITALFQENTPETHGLLTDKTDKSPLMSVMSVHDQGVLEEKTHSDTELIQQAFREGRSVRWWSGVLKEWIWWSPDKASARVKKQETDEVVYHKEEIAQLLGWNEQDIKTIHSLKKEFNGEITE